MNPNTPMIAVITGDVVNSTAGAKKASAGDMTLDATRTFLSDKSVSERAHIYEKGTNGDQSLLWLEQLKAALGHFGVSPHDWQIYRGDSFQLWVENPENSIAIAIWLKAVMRSLGIKGLDVRMAIGVGRVDYVSDQVIESNGEAFIYSGTLFDTLKKRTLAIKTPWHELDKSINLCLKLALLTMDRWTANSAQIVSLSMQMPHATQSEIAQELNIPQSRVSEGLDRAGYEAIMEMEQYCRDLMKHGNVIKRQV